MSEILVELGKLTQASQEQTAASNALSQEVAGKMAEIDKKAADAILPLGAIVVYYYVDPESGSDSNVGSQFSPLKTLDKALTLATAAELNGCTVTIYLKPAIDYHISKNYTAHTRIIIISAWGGEKPNVYIDPYVVNSSQRWFATYGLILYNSALEFVSCRVYTPLFSDIEGHDNIATSSDGGIVKPVPVSTKFISFSSSEIHVGDQFIAVPSPSDMTSLYFRGSSIHLRAGRVTQDKPITVNYGHLTVGFYSTQLNDELKIQEGSLFGGIKFKSGVPYNVVCNMEILEASL